MSKFISLAFLLTMVAVGVKARGFSGTGIIHVLQTANEKDADPNNKVGCLSTTGRFIKPDNTAVDCGLYTLLDVYPYSLSTSTGNCTFEDTTQPSNKDSHYGGNDYAWYCGNPTYQATIYDSLYTLSDDPLYLCFGDVACFYDAKKVPAAGEDLDLWQYRWGSQQMGITPGHVELQLLWEPHPKA